MDIAIYSVVIPLLAGIYFIRYNNIIIRVMLGLAVWGIISECMSSYTANKGITNYWISHIFVILEYCFLAAAYYYTFAGRLKKVVLYSLPVFLAFSVLNLFIFNTIEGINSYGRVLESVFLIVFAIAYFNKRFLLLDKQSLEHDPMFLLSAGVIFYFAGNVTAYSLFEQLLKESYDLARICLVFVFLTNIFFYCVQALVIYRAARS
ncbi:hypothetical protein DP923_11965 [Pontibacter arcticus]|uniref:YhhN-like protein n=2 Tax=Pontibacter arcticus TaxID=2080288 RepID=A0A364RDR8_9BACT|nr:hypothetical protein DP923_11965 [Pontibacter arcticus]